MALDPLLTARIIYITFFSLIIVFHRLIGRLTLKYLVWGNKLISRFWPPSEIFIKWYERVGKEKAEKTVGWIALIVALFFAILNIDHIL